MQETMTSIPHANFVPKNKTPTTTWENISVQFSGFLWGIKAHEVQAHGSRKLFTYPLVITEVKCGGGTHLTFAVIVLVISNTENNSGEAWCRGVIVGDVIVEINSTKITPHEDLRKLESKEEKVVSDTIQNILRIGGNILCCCGSKED
jgi:hypothetical protein